MHFEISDQGIFREIHNIYCSEQLGAARLVVALNLSILLSSCILLQYSADVLCAHTPRKICLISSRQ